MKKFKKGNLVKSIHEFCEIVDNRENVFFGEKAISAAYAQNWSLHFIRRMIITKKFRRAVPLKVKANKKKK